MNFTVYSKRLCPYCERIKKVLEHVSAKDGSPVVIYELDTDFSKEQFYQQFGEGSTFPQVTVNGVHIGGCTNSIKYLQENNVI